MSQDFEDRLRESLRAVDPDEGFAERVMAKIDRSPPAAQHRRFRWYAVGLAASVAMCAVLVFGWQVKREQDGLAARAQLIEALRVTGRKLDIAYQAVNNEDHRGSADTGGGV